MRITSYQEYEHIVEVRITVYQGWAYRKGEDYQLHTEIRITSYQEYVNTARGVTLYLFFCACLSTYNAYLGTHNVD